ncbi:hypothetical protein EUX98_g4960 [Antrodiella citrinella]|uniref:DNA polymerase delta subunit 4 n=1 Tax=Antrodiella citrinella TaxID=2447956 RepID=A0A4S4MVH0_9APHY|nr:hypothetical protein EUX98_g4960 [Antrodiella citrinella]
MSARKEPQSTSAALKQGRLQFNSRRATSANANGGKGKGKAPTTASSSDGLGKVGVVEDAEELTAGSRKRKLEDGEGKRTKRVFDSRQGEENSQDTTDVQEPTVTHAPAKLRLNDPKWKKPYAAAKEKMGYMQPIHAQAQNKIHHILRIFDLYARYLLPGHPAVYLFLIRSYEYGPCVGVTRLERWERAEALGLNPPPEVKDMLMTKEALEEDQYKQCVFHEYEV